MMKQGTVVLATAMATMALMLAGCGGGSSNPGTDSTPTKTPSAPPPQGLSQGSIDSHTAMNIIFSTVDLYNQNVAGRTQGAYNGATVNCPNGGTALIRGLVTRATNSNLTTQDLTYTMNNCMETKADHSFAYSGVVTVKGSFDDSVSFMSEAIQSTGSVTMNGTITVPGFNAASVDQATTFTINRGYGSATGSIGGRVFSYGAGGP